MQRIFFQDGYRMLFQPDQQHSSSEKSSPQTLLPAEAGMPRSGLPATPVLLLLIYLIVRILYFGSLSVLSSFALQASYQIAIVLLTGFTLIIVRLLLPTILLVLLLRKRHAFLNGMTILAVLDGIALLAIVQPALSIMGPGRSLTMLSGITIAFYTLSIIGAIYANNAKAIRQYCCQTPSLDRKRLLDHSHSPETADPSTLVGIRGWLGLFMFYLCTVIVVTIGILVWSLAQIDGTNGTVDYPAALSPALVLGFIFYLFPLISLVRLLRRRLDFRNSFVTGTIIDLVMVLSLMIAPDGKVFRPIMPYMLCGVLLMIAWSFYLFRSKRVLLSYPNGKPAKSARVDGKKWRQLY